MLTPREFAARVEAARADAGLDVEVLDETAHARARDGPAARRRAGQRRAAALIVLRHEPRRRAGLAGHWARRQGRDVRHRRHVDQAGRRHGADEGRHGRRRRRGGGDAARWRAWMRRSRVIGIIPTAENMPGGRAIRPGDVLRGASGKTVEVINTDAEGRLILGDALWYAQQLGATHLVDVATLTGASWSRSAGRRRASSAQPETWVDTRATAAASRAGDRVWHVADLRGSARAASQRNRRHRQLRRPAGRRRHGGGVSAGVRRRRPVGAPRHRRHGVGRNEGAVSAKGATGVAVRTLIEIGAMTRGRPTSVNPGSNGAEGDATAVPGGRFVPDDQPAPSDATSDGPSDQREQRPGDAEEPTMTSATRRLLRAAP